MAQIVLTIYGVVTQPAESKTEKDEKTDVTMSIGGNNVTGGKFSKKMSYMERDKSKPDSKWQSGGPDDVNFSLSIEKFTLHQKMYSPDEIVVDLYIKPECADTAKERKVNFSRDDLKQLFAKKQVSLDCYMPNGTDFYTLDRNYYVHEIVPRKYADKTFVTLKIYSPDKLLTVAQGCKSWTAKRLKDDILDSELSNYPLPYDDGNHLECDTTQMKHLQLVGGTKDKPTYTGHIFPYLVQYNESFYDMLARTTNRWGEFMYYYDGKLHIGYDKTQTAKEISGYQSVTYHDNGQDSPIQDSYASEAPYENHVLKSMVMKDTAAMVMGTINKAFDKTGGADIYWFSKVSQLLSNSQSVINFVFNTAVTDLLMWAQMASSAKLKNEAFNKQYFKKEKKYISTEPEQYDEKETLYNQFSELAPIVDAGTYAKILVGEFKAAGNRIEIDYDTTAPGLHLGQLIQVDGTEYIVTEIKASQPETFTTTDNKTFKKGVDTNRIQFQVTAIAKVEDPEGFYPPMIPSGHIRTSGPQVAVVVDVDDPNKKNRVRVKYLWQLNDVLTSIQNANKKQLAEGVEAPKPSHEDITAKDLKGNDISDATPWLLYAAPSGPSMAGVHARHYMAEKVLVNYANNNVERPFVVGAVTTDIPVSLTMNKGAAVLAAPNGQSLKVHEGSGQGATAFLAGINPGLNFVKGFCNWGDWFGEDNEMSKCFEGGVEMTDKYGIWSIRCSTDSRSVMVNSAWGNVMINAFTGIMISAPNGDIRISGKNVSIEAGNNLTLTSGANIKNKFASLYGDGLKFNAASFTKDAVEMAVNRMTCMVMNFFDLSILRSLIEVFWRPQEGCLSIESNRYLKLSAAGAKAGYPDAAYKNPQAKAQENMAMSGMLEMGPYISKLLDYTVKYVDMMIDRYKTNYTICKKKKEEFDLVIHNLLQYSDASDESQLCNTYEALKGKFWDSKTTEITTADMDFKDSCNDESYDKVGQVSLTKQYHYPITNFVNLEYIQKPIQKKRKELKTDVVKKANELLKSIITLRTMPLVRHVKVFYTREAPANYAEDFIKVFSIEGPLKDSDFYKYAYIDPVPATADDGRMNLTSDNPCDAALESHRTALIRRAALELVEGWGMELTVSNTYEKPTTDTDLMDDDKWYQYVHSLKFNRVINKEMNSMAATAMFGAMNTMFWTPIGEYSSWGNPKDGEILFGTGLTYSLKKNGAISELDSKYNQERLSKATFGEEEERKYLMLNLQVRAKLDNIV